MSKVFFSLKLILILLLIQGCSGNGFHLRKNVELAPQFSKVQLQGVASESEFSTLFSDALFEAGGSIVNDANLAKSTIIFSKFEEGRRVIAYTSDRRAREYLVFLKIEYRISKNTDQSNNKLFKVTELAKKRINIDRSYLFDPDFALGKAEEEERVKQTLYEEATRLILLRLKYSK
ncbi:MAG: LPS assembly lipoprotein LptE [Cocleimonas sp.]